MIQKVRGTNDILPADTGQWQALEAILREASARYGFREIRTPVFEKTELFARGIGEGTDIVSKEMYTFTDMGNRSITLRPELTASVARAVAENKLLNVSPTLRLWYAGPLFRQENPQKGRYRQFHQYGAELIGSSDPAADVDIIALGDEILRTTGLTEYTLQLNSLGSFDDRTRYRTALVEYFTPIRDELSEESRKRLVNNPLRILDSKHPDDKKAVTNAPNITDYLSDESKRFFDDVRSGLQNRKIPFEPNPRLVRGLDYYCHTAFEFVTDKLGSQNALCGGGRYDGLLEQIGGGAAPGVGFAMGLERILLLLREEERLLPERNGVDCYVVANDTESRKVGDQAAHSLRAAGLTVITDLQQRSMKAQMRDVNRSDATLGIIIGENERVAGQAAIRNMETSEQILVPLEDLTETVCAKLAAQK